MLDFFAGSGTTGHAAHELGRNFTLVDQSEESVELISKRLSDLGASFELKK